MTRQQEDRQIDREWGDMRREYKRRSTIRRRKQRRLEDRLRPGERVNWFVAGVVASWFILGVINGLAP